MRSAVVALSFGVAALLALGMVMLISASTATPDAQYLVMQPIWCCIGLVALGTTALVDYRWLKQHPWTIWVLFGCVLALLGLVFVPGVGARINGANRWLKLGPLTVQPSELAKLSLILLLAWYGDRYQRWMTTCVRGMLIPSALVGVVLGLVFLEPDVGTTVLLGAVSAVVMFLAGTRLRFMIPAGAAAVAGLIIFILNNPVRLKRVLVFMYPDAAGGDAGYQTDQSVIAVGSGGIWGLGLGNGRQKLGFLPEHHTDFIFAVVGEELGLTATIGVLLAFLLIIFCGFYIATKARDTYGMLLGCGLTALVGLQAGINVGVVTGALPNKGLSLPFISYGGSNLVVMLACIGMLMSIARSAGEPERLPRPAEAD